MRLPAELRAMFKCSWKVWEARARFYTEFSVESRPELRRLFSFLTQMRARGSSSEGDRRCKRGAARLGGSTHTGPRLERKGVFKVDI